MTTAGVTTASETPGAVCSRIDGAVAVITIARPPLNLIDIALLDELIAALEAARDNDAVRAAILTTGLDRAFSAGLDLRQVLDGGSAVMRAMLQKLYIELYDVQNSLGKPSIAAVEGIARGGGMTLAVSCDAIVAASDTSFGYPELNVGILPGLHFTHLPRLVGRHKAFELLFAGEPFDATTARDLGLVNRLAEPGGALATAMTLAKSFAQKPASAVAIARENFMRINDRDYRNQIASVVDEMARMVDSEETQHALRTFLNRSSQGD